MNRDAITQAVVDLLDTHGVLVGRGVKPKIDPDRTTLPAVAGGWQGAPGQSVFQPYAIVWRIGSKDLTHRDLDAVYDERRPLLHIRTVGGTPSEADQHLDAADEVLATHPLEVAGFAVVHLIYDTSITATKDDDVDPPVFYTGSYWRPWLQETP